MSKLKVMDLYSGTGERTVENFSANTRSSLLVNTDVDKVEVDFEWLFLMEDTIKYLDNILRNPNRFIVNE